MFEVVGFMLGGGVCRGGVERDKFSFLAVDLSDKCSSLKENKCRVY
jgi:hypothetical protein